jgi:hypothetical protein
VVAVDIPILIKLAVMVVLVVAGDKEQMVLLMH